MVTRFWKGRAYAAPTPHTWRLGKACLQGDQLYIANAGDSRAVLCRGPDAVALSEDHKPASEAEKARIMAAGGFISDVGGVIRRVAPLVAASQLACLHERMKE